MYKASWAEVWENSRPSHKTITLHKGGEVLVDRIPEAKSIEEGLVLLTSEVERGKLREVQWCLLARIGTGGRMVFGVLSVRSVGSCTPLGGRYGTKLQLGSCGLAFTNLY